MRNSEQIANFNNVFQTLFPTQGVEVTNVSEHFISIKATPKQIGELNVNFKNSDSLRKNLEQTFDVNIKQEIDEEIHQNELVQIRSIMALPPKEILEKIMPEEFINYAKMLNLKSAKYDKNLVNFEINIPRPIDLALIEAKIKIIQTVLSNPKVGQNLLNDESRVPIISEELDSEPNILGKDILSYKISENKKSIDLRFNYDALHFLMHANLTYAKEPPLTISLDIENNIHDISRSYFLRFLKNICPDELVRGKNSPIAYLFNAQNSGVADKVNDSQLYFLIDNTSSLKSNRDSYMEGIKEILTQITAKVPNSTLHIIPFGFSIDNHYKKFKASQIDEIIKHIDVHINLCEDATGLYYSMSETIKKLQTQKTDGVSSQIILFTDGAENCSRETYKPIFEKTVKEARQNGNPFQMRIWGFGDCYKQGKAELKKICKSMGIKNKIAETAEELFSNLAPLLEGINMVTNLRTLIMSLDVVGHEKISKEYVTVAQNSIEEVKVKPEYKVKVELPKKPSISPASHSSSI